MALSVGYAVWNSPYAMTTVGSGSGLTANGWNALVNNIADLNSRWSQVGALIQIAFQQSTTPIGPSTSTSFIDQGVTTTITIKSVSSNILIEGSLTAILSNSEVGYTIFKQVNGGAWTDIDPSASGNGIARIANYNLTDVSHISLSMLDTSTHAVGDILTYNIRARMIGGTSFHNYGRGSDLKTLKITEIAK